MLNTGITDFRNEDSARFHDRTQSDKKLICIPSFGNCDLNVVGNFEDGGYSGNTSAIHNDQIQLAGSCRPDESAAIGCLSVLGSWTDIAENAVL